jgi:hydrogenase nickel incorporation protein HypA/HybF
MHELKIAQDVLNIIEQEAKKNRISRVNKFVLRIGKLRQCFSSFLKYIFQIITKETIAEAAEVIIEEIDITACCKKCHTKFIVHKHNYLCPNCGSGYCEIITGDEIILVTIEGEQDDN